MSRSRPSTIVSIALLFLSTLLSAASPPQTEIQTDSRTGLAWLCDSSSVVRAGVVDELLLPKAALAARLKAFNAHAAAKFGTSDWRVAKPREIRGRLLSAAPAEAARLRALLAGSRGSAGQRVAFVLVRAEAISAGFAGTVAFATNSIHLKNGSTIESGDVIANQASSGPWLASGAELTFGPSATAAAGSDLKGDSVRIKSKSVVGGDVFANDVQNQGTVLGSVHIPLSLPVLALLPAFHSGPPGTTAVIVPAGQSQVLAPGDYAALTLGDDAVVNLTGGTYRFASIASGSRAQVLFDAAAEVQIAGRLALGTDGILAPSSSATIGAADIVFYVAGINGTTGDLAATPQAAEIGVRCKVIANLYVPNGTLDLKQGASATGAFLARDLAAGPRASFTLASAFVNHPPVALDDAATVEEGGSVNLLDSGAASLLANDSDPDGDPLSVTTSALSGPSHGSLTLNPDGTFLYTHGGGDDPSDSFVYEACDTGFPILCDTATVAIAIQPARTTVSVRKVGAGSGRVVSLPAGIDCGPTCAATFSPPTILALAADADPGSLFSGFSGDPGCGSPFVVGFADRECIATFDLPGSVTLTVVKEGTGDGRVTSTPAGVDCGTTCSASFPRFSRVELEAAADPGSVFVGFGGDPECEDGSVPMNVSRTCRAVFRALPTETRTLRVRIVGGGAGFVRSVPAGIGCTSDCSAAFPANTTVALFAREDDDSVFVEWGGDCAGTARATTVTLEDDKTCTATINLGGG